MRFSQPHFLWLFLTLPIMLAWYFFVLRKKKATINFSQTAPFQFFKPTLKQRLVNMPLVLRLLAVSAIILGLARPQSSSKGRNVSSEGISIVMALDISESMLAEDFKPNRIEAAKSVAIDFVKGRATDQIGLVIFKGESFTSCPITTDHSVLVNLLSKLNSDLIPTPQTAIGEGLATAVARVKDAKTKSKVVILLTDGQNNAGSIAPAMAGEIAKTFGVRVYTIGVGTKGFAPYPMRTPFGIQYQNIPVEIDEDVLQAISKQTDGKYFRATNKKKLQEIYAEIDKMEKTKINVTEFRRYTEEYLPFAVAAAFLLLLEFLLKYLILKSLP
ncbi:MAG: VWA domain-containing protein [Bacteroidetes bacterium]|nr:VWA domain-containing protein [Bacteroidota bacterium]